MARSIAYIYVIDSKGNLIVHVVKEGNNIFDAQDKTGRYFIREMCWKAVEEESGKVQFITYPWRNDQLGEKYPRQQRVAYLYFEPWDWIIAASGYLDETYEDSAFERQAFQELEQKLLNKKVGATGYIYTMTSAGVLKIHPFLAGKNIYDTQDEFGRYFIREMCERKNGWIRAWFNPR